MSKLIAVKNALPGTPKEIATRAGCSFKTALDWLGYLYDKGEAHIERFEVPEDGTSFKLDGVWIAGPGWHAIAPSRRYSAGRYFPKAKKRDLHGVSDDRLIAFMREFLADNDCMPHGLVIAKRFGFKYPGIGYRRLRELEEQKIIEKNAIGGYRFKRASIPHTLTKHDLAFVAARWPERKPDAERIPAP